MADNSHKTTAWYAQQYVERFGMVIVPIEPGRKYPLRDDWGLHGIEQPQEAHEFFESHPDWNIGVALGPSGYCSFDVDCLESLQIIAEEFGVPIDDLPTSAPTVQGASKGFRVIYSVPPGKQLPYAKLTWPDPDNPAKQYTVMELRASTDGKQRQDVLPPSIHPDTGDPYQWICQPTNPWPEPPDWLIAVWEAWDKFRPQFKDACPWAEKRESPAVTKAAQAPAKRDGGSVIEQYCQSVSIQSALDRYGYKPKGKRFLSPHSTTAMPGVVVFEDKQSCWIHHASDPLCSDETGRPVNAFDLFAYYDHNGDISAAVKQAAQELGLQPDPSRRSQSSGQSQGATGTDMSATVMDEVNWIDWPDQTDKGKALSTERNLRHLLTLYGITVRYNLVTKDTEILIPGEAYTDDNRYNATIAKITDICQRHRMPVTNLGEYLTLMSERNRYNPVVTWVQSSEWDGNSRFDELMGTLAFPRDDNTQQLYRALVYRWMLSAIHAVFSPSGISSQGILVLQGPQETGKTRWLRSIAADWFLEGATLDPKDKDSVMLAVSHWIVELGEVDATFRKADIAQLKSFVTRDHDVVRKPYDRSFSNLPRRTVFCASVNDAKYLVDPTGNRRYWTVEVDTCDWQHGIDMQQVWAELLHDYRNGAQWYLTAEESRGLASLNAAHEAPDPVEELIHSHFDFAAPSWTEEYSASEVLRVIGFDRPTNGQCKKAADVMREATGKPPRKTNGRWVFKCPQPVDNRYSG